MNKLIFSGSLACVLFLIVGTYFFPTNMVMWFAGTSTSYTIFRCIMAAALLAVLITTPPRRLLMRLAMGLVATGLLTAGIVLSASDTMHVLDVILYLQLGISFAIEALEFNEEELDEKVAKLRLQYASDVLGREQKIARYALQYSAK